MNEHDANLSLLAAAELRFADDPLEETQRLTFSKRRQLAEEARRLHEQYRASAGIIVEERQAWPDFREVPRGHLTQTQRDVQDMRCGDDE